MINEIYDQNPFNKNPDPLLQKDIHLLLLNAKSNYAIDAQDLQHLSFVVSKQEFEQFCQNKAINITEDKFKDLDLSSYKYEDQMPIKLLSNDSNYKLVDLLLNRTYSDSISGDSIKKIYNNIYSLGQDAREMLTYTATLIANRHPLKIIFENGTLSYYSSMQEIIKIDTKFMNDSVFNIESVVAHEMKHFIYQQAFNNNISPINVTDFKTSLKNLTDSFGFIDGEDNDNENISYFMNNYPSVFTSISQNLLSEDSALSKFLATYNQYLFAAKAPLEHAAKLLQVESINSNITYEWAQHLKFNSYIDLFRIKSKSHVLKEMIGDDLNVSGDTYHVLLDWHQEYDGTPRFYNKTELTKWAREELYPDVVSKLNISKAQIHFLERMSDFVNRAEFFSNEGYGFDSNDDTNPLDVELIVRSLELKAAFSNETDIINSFSALDQYHEDHVSPVISLFLAAHINISNLAFSDQYLMGAQEVCDIPLYG
jgi:hypothetical protein